MGIFDFFKKKETLPPFDLANFGIDIHSHLIPGIDDGSPSMDHTIAMLTKFKELGYRKVITTPHIMSDGFPNIPSGKTIPNFPSFFNNCMHLSINNTWGGCLW